MHFKQLLHASTYIFYALPSFVLGSHKKYETDDCVAPILILRQRRFFAVKKFRLSMLSSSDGRFAKKPIDFRFIYLFIRVPQHEQNKDNQR